MVNFRKRAYYLIMESLKGINVFGIAFFVFFLFAKNLSFAQNPAHGLINKTTLSFNSTDYNLYEFSSKPIAENKVKVKYLVHDAYRKFIELKKEKNILLVTAASYTSAFFSNGTPIGLCAFEGEFLNKMPNQIMDGLVVSNFGGLVLAEHVYDLDMIKNDTIDINSQLNPRESALDSYLFYSWVEKNKLSVFQTQLVYSHLKTKEENFKSLYSGSDSKQRRFLVVAKKENILRNLIVGSPKRDYVMKASKDVFDMLSGEGYEIQFILNLDTGSKNLLYVNNGKFLENLKRNTTTKLARIERASNLIVFFFDK